MLSFISIVLIWSTLTPVSLQFITTPSSLPPPKRLSDARDNVDNCRNKSKEKAYEFHIAPMQCYTNLPLRKLFGLLSPSSILWTEMEKVNDILQSHTDGCGPDSNKNDSLVHAWSKRIGSPFDHHSNLVLQFGCNDPVELKSCISRTLQDYTTLKGINLNCGCPSIESGGANYYGASLMKDSQLTGELVCAMKEAIFEDTNSQFSPEISVKCRIGVIDNFHEMRPLNMEKDYEYLLNYVSTMKDAGVDHVILHARPAVLSGLSPVKNRIAPELNYDIVERIASEFQDLRVTMNGGIVSLHDLKKMIHKCKTNQISSHMAGRWCLRRPLDLVAIESMLQKEERENISAVQAIEEYIDFVMGMISTSPQRREITTAELCLPLYLVSEQLREDYDSYLNEDEVNGLRKENTLTIDEIEEIYDVLSFGTSEIQSMLKGGKKVQSITNDLSFKKLSKSFKSVAGTKIVNKWKRNRGEL